MCSENVDIAEMRPRPIVNCDAAWPSDDPELAMSDETANTHPAGEENRVLPSPAALYVCVLSDFLAGLAVGKSMDEFSSVRSGR